MWDLIWPHLSGEPDPVLLPELAADDISGETLDAVEREIERVWSAVEDRIKLVEAKLTALFTQLSILSVLTTAAVPASLAADLSSVPRVVLAAVLLSLFYIGMQVICSLLSVVRGLRRRNFKTLGPHDLRPVTDETGLAFRRRVLVGRWAATWWNDAVANEKVSHMEVAHVALRNALVIVGSLLILASVYAGYRVAT